MNIALDIRGGTDFGVATYIRNIIRGLVRLDGGDPNSTRNRYILIGKPDRLRELRPLPENFVLQPYPWPQASPRSYLAFRGLVKKHRCDLLHIPHLYKTPRFSPCPYVVTVHDLLAFLQRRSQQTPFQSQYRLVMARYALRHASKILAVSNSTKIDMQRVFGVGLPPDYDHKVEVAYNAIDERFQRGHASQEDCEFIAERYQVNYPFLLYAGTIKPHKNLGRLIEAFSALKGELKKDNKFPDLKLIIIGDDLSSHPDLRRTVIKSAVQNDVRFLGFVPIDVLRIFYDVAKIFVFPSLYEGFGLPPLEAMAHGTPVVTSNTSSLPEVVGNAAVLVNPENVFEIMHALHRVLLDQPLREVLKQRGYTQAAKFSWDASVEKILHVYEQAVRS
ncbi:MAG: glycosyl transferase, group 1 [Acidobacteriales bacterium]|nr:glycosyl transferase, group 1 [Terriglobales bacterium]